MTSFTMTTPAEQTALREKALNYAIDIHKYAEPPPTTEDFITEAKKIYSYLNTNEDA